MSTHLERLTWMEAERVLTPDAVVMIPLGAAAKEHGPHLPLDNDRTLAEYLARRVADVAEVVVAPTVAYHFYPAFVEYPGSTTLRLETARDLMIDIAVSLASFGPRRFYVLNTGVSTARALRPAVHALSERGIAMRFTDIGKAGRHAVEELSEQDGGTHADEIETSMMLYIAPETVDMSKAAHDFHSGSGPLTRNPGGEGVYSPTGIYGDATLATVEKGRVVVEAMVLGIVAEVQALARSTPPSPSTQPSA